MGIIYTIVNRTTRKIYVGQTWESLRIRWGRHKYKALHGDTSCRHLYAAIRKYGSADFDIQIKAKAENQEQLDWLERYWIKVLLASNRDFGYNLKSGGSAGRHTAETRARMSATHKAHPNSGVFKWGQITVKRVRGFKPWNLGIPRTKTEREHISVARTGIRQSPEVTRRRMAATHLTLFLKTVAWG